MKLIQSRDNPLYKSLLKLANSARQRNKSGQALLEGVHLVAACLDAGHLPERVLLTDSALHDGEISALLGRLKDVPQTLLDDRLFQNLSELKSPAAIMALIDVPQVEVSIADIGFALLLDDIQDPGNLGSMLRSAAAAGCDAVFLSGGCADAWSPRVLRAAMGGHFALRIAESADLPAVAGAFRGRLFAAVLGTEHSLFDCDLCGDLGFVIGNEGAGVSAALRAVCQPVHIPMPGKVESLNAAAAAAVCLFEAIRQRR